MLYRLSKALLVFFAFACGAFLANGGVVDDSTSSFSTWGSDSTWKDYAAPVDGDDVIIDSKNITITYESPTFTSGSITISGIDSVHTLFINNGQTLGGNFVGTIGEFGQLEFGNGSYLNGGTWSVYGLVYTYNSSTFLGGTFSIEAGGIIYSANHNGWGGGTIINNGGLLLDGSGADSGTGTLRSNIGLNYSNSILAGAAMSIEDGGYLTTSALDAITGGTFSINNGGTIYAGVAGSISGGDFTINEGGQITAYAASGITGGNITVKSGGLLYSSFARSVDGASVIMETGSTYNVLRGANLASLSGDGTVYSSIPSLGASYNFTVNQDANTEWTGEINNMARVVKQGAGEFKLNRSAGGSIGDSTIFQVDAGRLALGASSQFTSNNNMILNGGTFATNGFSEALGTLTLGGNAVIDLSSAGTLSFTDSSALSWSGSLTLLNYDTSAQISFAGQGLTSSQLSMISFNGITAAWDGSTDYLTFEELIADFYGISTSKTANWDTGSTWDAGSAPTSGSNVYLIGGKSATLSSTFDLGGGTLTIGNGTTLSTLTVTGDLQGSFTGTVAEQGVLDITSASASVAGGSWNVSGLVRTVDEATLTGGTWSIDPGGILITDSGSSWSGATIVKNGGLVLDGSGATSGHGILTDGYIDLELSGMMKDGATLTIDGGTLYSTGVNVFHGGTFYFNDGGRASIGGTGTILGGDWTINSGGRVIVGGSAVRGGAFNILNGGEFISIGVNTLLGGDFTMEAGSSFTVDLGGTISSLDGAGTVTGASGRSLTIDQDTNTVWAGEINTFSGFTKSGTGTFTLNNSSGNAIADATSVTVSGGTLALGASNQINDSASLVLSGGTFATNGNSETLGTLVLSSDSTIQLDSGVHTLTFADSSAESWSGTLSIEGWTGDGDGGDYGRIYVADEGLTAAQRSQIQWAGGNLVGADFISGTNELIPNLSSLSGTGSVLVMQVVEDGGITLISPVSVPMPAQTVTTSGGAAYVSSVSETYPVIVQDVRGVSSPITVSATVNPLTNGGIVRGTTLSVDSTSGDTTGITTSSVEAASGSASGTLISATSAVNRQFDATLRVDVEGLSGSNAVSGTYSGSVVLTVN